MAAAPRRAALRPVLTVSIRRSPRAVEPDYPGLAGALHAARRAAVHLTNTRRARAQDVSAVDISVSPDGHTISALFVYGQPPYPTQTYNTQACAAAWPGLARAV